MQHFHKTALLLTSLIATFGISAPVSHANQGIETIRDCEDICPEMVIIPAGEFIMGPSEAEDKWFKDSGGSPKSTDREMPAHPVKIDYSFAVGKYEVKRGEYARFLQETGYTPDKNACFTYEKDIESDEYSRKLRENRGWQNPGFEQTDNHPVACVSWPDAKAYIGWLNEKTSQNYRLLTETEWEYVARADTTTHRFWGDDENNADACEFANIKDESTFPDGHVRETTFNCNDGFSGTAPVGSFKPNAFGVYDILGNQVEWVEDCWNEGYIGAPNDGSARLDGNCGLRILRSGSWYYNPINIRSAGRFRVTHTNRGTDFSFRLARDVN